MKTKYFFIVAVAVLLFLWFRKSKNKTVAPVLTGFKFPVWRYEFLFGISDAVYKLVLESVFQGLYYDQFREKHGLLVSEIQYNAFYDLLFFEGADSSELYKLYLNGKIADLRYSKVDLTAGKFQELERTDLLAIWRTVYIRLRDKNSLYFDKDLSEKIKDRFLFEDYFAVYYALKSGLSVGKFTISSGIKDSLDLSDSDTLERIQEFFSSGRGYYSAWASLFPDVPALQNPKKVYQDNNAGSNNSASDANTGSGYRSENRR